MKMRRWSKKEIEGFVNSDSFKKYTDDFIKRMERLEADRKKNFDMDEWTRIIHTPMSI